MEKQKEILKVVVPLLFVLVIVLAVFGYQKYQDDQIRGNLMDKYGVTSVKPRLSQNQQLTILKDYPEVYQALTKDDKGKPTMFAIPGLDGSVTFQLKDNQMTVVEDMTPQGIALSEDYIFISEYSHSHQFNSVIQVLNRRTKQFEKTIPVPGKPHLGGLVYDPQFDNLWLTTKTPYFASLSRISLAAIEDYDVYEEQKPISYDNEVSLMNVPDASLIGYLGQAVMVGYFDKNHDGLLAMYPFNNEGEITSYVESKEKTTDLGEMDRAHEVTTSDTGEVMKKIQGVTFDDNYMYLSQSFGPHNSKLYIFDMQDTVGGFGEKAAKKAIEFPPYLEQVTIEGNQLYAVFEGGAKAYRGHTKKNVDYVLELDKKSLLKGIKKN